MYCIWLLTISILMKCLDPDTVGFQSLSTILMKLRVNVATSYWGYLMHNPVQNKKKKKKKYTVYLRNMQSHVNLKCWKNVQRKLHWTNTSSRQNTNYKNLGWKKIYLPWSIVCHFFLATFCPHVLFFFLCSSAHSWGLSCQNVSTVSLPVFRWENTIHWWKYKT